jgi:hypothetical protein
MAAMGCPKSRADVTSGTLRSLAAGLERLRGSRRRLSKTDFERMA